MSNEALTDEEIDKIAEPFADHGRLGRFLEYKKFARAIEARALASLPEGAAASIDAKRYRWLRDVSQPGICTFYLSVGNGLHGVRFTRETVDNAIDAQIAAIDEATKP